VLLCCEFALRETQVAG